MFSLIFAFQNFMSTLSKQVNYNFWEYFLCCERIVFEGSILYDIVVPRKA